MPKSELLQLIQSGDFETFDNRCLELLQAGSLKPCELVGPFEALRDAGQTERVAALTPMLFEALDWESDAAGGVELAKAALSADPKNPDLRQKLSEAYERAYGDVEGFEQVLDASGLAAGRAFRNASKVLDFGLTLKIGDFLICRMDDRAVEVVEIDRPNALITLQRESRKTTIALAEMARDYDQVEADDFRVLRQLRPERLSDLLESDPVALVVGLIHAHGDLLDQDRLRDELVPRYLDAKSWSKWWTKTRGQLKRNKHVVIEGRSPVVLTYNAKGLTLEDEVEEAFAAAKEPTQWYSIVKSYIAEKEGRKEPANADLLKRLHQSMLDHIGKVRERRPSEALATALVINRLGEVGLPVTDESKRLAAEKLRKAEDVRKLIVGLGDNQLWDGALSALQDASGDEYGAQVVTLMGDAPAIALDRIAADALVGGQLAGVQDWIEKALDDLLAHPEIVYWMWKGPKNCEGVRFPSDELLLEEIIDTLFGLGRSLNPPANVMRDFRQRIRSALALKDYGRYRACIEATDFGRAVTLRHQIVRIEGIGDNMRTKLLDILRDKHPELWAKPAAKRLEAWEDRDVIWTTEAGLRKKTTERDQIVNVEMRENAKRIGAAAALGDLSENSEYKFALEERDLLRARVAQINQDLSMAQPLHVDVVPTEHVGVGSRVALRSTMDGSERVITFLGPFDADVEAGVYNYLAPVSLQLMGLKIGDRAKLTTNKDEVEYEITSIANGLAVS